MIRRQNNEIFVDGNSRPWKHIYKTEKLNYFLISLVIMTRNCKAGWRAASSGLIAGVWDFSYLCWTASMPHRLRCRRGGKTQPKLTNQTQTLEEKRRLFPWTASRKTHKKRCHSGPGFEWCTVLVRSALQPQYNLFLHCRERVLMNPAHKCRTKGIM